MERLHILDECTLPLMTLKNKIKSLFIRIHKGGKATWAWFNDIFQNRNISLNLYPHIAYDI